MKELHTAVGRWIDAKDTYHLVCIAQKEDAAPDVIVFLAGAVRDAETELMDAYRQRHTATYEQQIDACEAAIGDAYYEENPYTMEQRERLNAAMDTIRRHKELMVAELLRDLDRVLPHTRHLKMVHALLERCVAALSSQVPTVEVNRAKVRLYEELLYAVATKHPNESRHETALRYIRRAENHDADRCGQVAAKESP